MLVTESTETKLKNVLDEFINRLNTAEERISELREKSKGVIGGFGVVFAAQ